MGYRIIRAYIPGFIYPVYPHHFHHVPSGFHQVPRGLSPFRRWPLSHIFRNKIYHEVLNAHHVFFPVRKKTIFLFLVRFFFFDRSCEKITGKRLGTTFKKPSRFYRGWQHQHVRGRCLGFLEPGYMKTNILVQFSRETHRNQMDVVTCRD